MLEANDLHVSFDTPEGTVDAVRGVSFRVSPGECLGIVGESGSGKSQTCLAAMRLLATNSRTQGAIHFQGQDLLPLDNRSLNRIRGRRLSMIFQDPLTALTPHLKIGTQMREVLSTHRKLRGKAAATLCCEWLERVHMPDPERRMTQYPHELSGGMRQRIMIAMAMLCEPEVLFADEPTTALDVTIQAEILELMDGLRKDHNTAIVLITHDMGVVARLCDRVHVMRHGQFVESGEIEQIFYQPRADYTRRLLESVPRITLNSNPAVQQATPVTDKGADPEQTVLSVNDMQVHFPLPRRWFKPASVFKAVDGVSFDLKRGETLAVVGESGSGKSTLARAVLQLIPPTGGTVSWLGTSLQSLDARALRRQRRDLQIVFQDPLASLDPSMTVGQSIMEPLRVHDPSLNGADRRRRVATMMEQVGLDARLINRFPHELSGGQNQRVGIARATIMNPELVICDEAVSALDVSIQSQIIDLLNDLQTELGLSYIFISHDMSVVWTIAHRVLVLYRGRIVELAERDALFGNPQHPYTQQLLSAVPIPDPVRERQRQRIRLRKDLPAASGRHAALRFMPSRAVDDVQAAEPELQERFPGHLVAEHDALDELIHADG